MKIVVCKTGMTVYAPTHQHLAGQLGDQHNAWGVLSYLGHRYPGEAVFAGNLRGAPPEGVSHAPGDMSGVNEWDDDQQAEAVRVLDLQLRDLGVGDGALWIDLVGSSATMSWVDNPAKVSVQCSAARNVGVLLGAMQCMKAQRALIVTDFRCLPRNHEMNWWPHCRPIACLGQEPLDRSMKIRDINAQVIQVAPGVENWFSWNWPRRPIREPERPRDLGCVFLAHSHCEDKRWSGNGERDATLRAVLDSFPESFWRQRGKLSVHGLNWEHFSKYKRYRTVMRGPIEVRHVLPVMSHAETCPVLPPRAGFATTKVRKIALAGCAPLLWCGDTAPYPRERCKLPDALAFGGDFGSAWALHDRLSQDTRLRVDLVDAVCARTEPNFSRLDELIQGERDPRRVGGYLIS